MNTLQKPNFFIIYIYKVTCPDWLTYQRTAQTIKDTVVKFKELIPVVPEALFNKRFLKIRPQGGGQNVLFQKHKSLKTDFRNFRYSS